jgi:predicted nucleic acid-binding protein
MTAVPEILPDTSCMVAAVCGWHEHHDPAQQEIARRLRQAEPMLVAAPALVEAYVVLTRLPAPHRLSPADALALLEANFMRAARIVALEGKSYRALLRRAPGDGIADGQPYDAVIAACALRVKGATLLTFNAHHFLPFSQRGLQVVVPGQA